MAAKPKIRLLPYHVSLGAKELSKALGIKRLRASGSTWKPKPGAVVVNWGCANYPTHWPDYGFSMRWLNNPQRVVVAVSKLQSLTLMQKEGINVPQFTQDSTVAKGWLSEGHSVVCRALDRGSGGRGITYLESDTDPSSLPQVGLYTRYEPRRDEYRLHVFRRPDGSYAVVDSAQKRKRKGVEVNYKVRTFENGWVYCREDLVIPPQAAEAACKAVQALGLDFGAVDLGWTRKTSTATVFEVNTAPGIEGTTVQKYADAMRTLIFQ